ncbi:MULTISPECIES: chromosome segregation protein SMC [Anaerococcus]|uniref:chromosome segregation protein SMC n=1 Tax=Anaerococcus TaxID=165779 RepID=UPI00242CCABA|nr:MULTISPECIES: chromosome segregation protein SMC [Anaerococcus]MDD7767199.1 chromosome segregation protein SMC [Anaerococcus vaginalis]MDY6127470.1 chromosome segregation protein SMC [Anaerococcus sp.]
MIYIRLESVELKGFKSFANRTKIKFDNQITAVVGPNGSGKSNIADAIKWVLGEQSVKSLRGKKMDDVIFQGADDKKPMNMAEVNLSFNNKDRALSSDYDLVKISRRIFRNGDNEYRLNGKRVRLKDIKELFLDTGIGKEGYSVIGQGRIDEILNSSNQERRNIFEEASGIATHKYRREESLKKLSKVDEDLEIIQREWDYKNKDKNKLEIEAKNFEKYTEIESLLNEKAYLFYANKSKSLNEKNKDLIEQIKILKNNQEEKTREFDKINESLLPIAENIRDLENKYKNLNQSILDNEKNIDKYTNKINLDRQKLLYNKKDLERNNNDFKSYDEKFKNYELSLKNQKDKLENTKNVIRNLEEKNKKLSEKKDESIDLLSSIQKEIERLKKEGEDLNKLIYDYDLDQKTRTILEKQRFENNKIINEKIQELNSDLSNISKDLNELEKEKENLSKDIEEKNTNLEKIKEKILNEINKKDDLEKAINQNKLSCKEEISNYKIQKSLMERNEGYFYSVSDFLKKTKNTEIEKLYINTLANLITVKSGYEEIIENLIGQGLQNIVTWSKKDTREIINFVNKNKLGRITFLPLDSIKQNKKARVEEKEVIAMAYDLVSYDSKLENIINHFLSNTVVVKNIDDAVSLSNKIKGYRIISLNLDLINTWGSMVAGVNKARKSNINILNRNKKINEIKSRINKLRNERNDLLENYNSLNIKLEENQRLRQIKEDELVEANENLIDIRSIFDKKNYQKQSLIQRIDELKESLNESKEEENFKDIEKIKLKLSNVKKEDEILKEKSIENSKLINDLSNEIFKNKNSIEINTRDLNILENRINEDENSLLNLKQNIEFNQKMKKSLEESLVNLEKEISACENKVVDTKEKVKEDEKNKIKISMEIDEKKNSNHKLLSLSKNIENELNEYSMKIVKFNYKLEAISKDLKNLEDEIRPFISKSLEDLKENNYENSSKQIKKEELFNLQKKLTQVGFFDENSKEDFEKAYKEFEFLDKQKIDLEKSKKDIEKMIKKLEEDMKDEFIKNFNIIDEKFQRIFKELFMGGKAKLSLDSNDLLDAGIDISACPPGKSTKNISLLSGGEKSLTAVALLFAIFETNPAPFSLLDEIDAAMDESNIKRYIDYLKSLSDKTQFIMITHRQTTMQLAEKIHGVTIGDGGISKIYSIDFDDEK